QNLMVFVARRCREITGCRSPECSQWFFISFNPNCAYVSKPSNRRLYILGEERLTHDVSYKWRDGFTVQDLRSREEAAQECADHGRHEWNYWDDHYDEEVRSCRRCRAQQK